MLDFDGAMAILCSARTVLKSFPNPRRFSHDEKPFLCLDAPTCPIDLRTRFHDRGWWVSDCSAIQPRPFQVTPLAQHWPISRWKDARRCRGAFATECFLYCSSERRGLEDG